MYYGYSAFEKEHLLPHLQLTGEIRKTVKKKYTKSVIAKSAVFHMNQPSLIWKMCFEIQKFDFRLTINLYVPVVCVVCNNSIDQLATGNNFENQRDKQRRKEQKATKVNQPLKMIVAYLLYLSFFGYSHQGFPSWNISTSTIDCYHFPERGYSPWSDLQTMKN